ncbi:cyclic nucleotide-binding domain-containing protein [Paraburkholderia sp. CNPSo 3157]|uniref:Cyclic nucleotide-binding domain-containing protein n=1 Tax=Paraburkholderia franconis TaxID=2654983 RepID=A0A7X1NKT0_9BURK|nr:cyclic nucleotide-binding domain-containing protein [Paraburkholderia franconis]MPW23281.1 cyclic nucleotide-binding domain-containing protein [Paraburkholderia franconis]
MQQQKSTWSRTAAPGEVIYSEGFGGESVMYVIADGKVEISTQCEDKKVIVATLGKGEFFGETALLPAEPRGNTAKALTFCQLTVVNARVVEEELERVSPLLRHIVRTMVRRVKKKDDLLATYTHADFMPGVISYAHVLSLMAGAEAQAERGWRSQTEEVSVPMREVIRKCRAIAGHSRLHVMVMLRRMEKLNLISMEAGRSEFVGSAATRHNASEGASDRQLVTFDPKRITERAHNVADQDLEVSVASELELIELNDLEALIGVERKMILNKLSRAEIAEDVFAFRKTKVLNYVEEKGITYFSRPARRAPGEVAALEDLEFVDQRSLFDAVSAFDTYDLAKMLVAMPDQSIADRLLGVMTEARKKEVSWVMRRDIKIDPVEVGDIEQRFLETVRTIRSSASAAGPAPGLGV